MGHPKHKTHNTHDDLNVYSTTPWHITVHRGPRFPTEKAQWCYCCHVVNIVLTLFEMGCYEAVFAPDFSAFLTVFPSLQRKRSAHERALAMLSSGEWSSGKRWADDAPKEQVEADSVSIINTGSCGANVHGLEDEFLGEFWSNKYDYCSVEDIHCNAFKLWKSELSSCKERQVCCLSKKLFSLWASSARLENKIKQKNWGKVAKGTDFKQI